uniref:Putative ddb1-and cul4-associated factor 4 n=1 Tax=Amblyomma triste TaxID=251400 RepID=A0A023G8X5_AMBTT
MSAGRRRHNRSVACGSRGKDEDDPFHLPGFYYDASQKRYFRLRPGQNRHNPLTVASIDAKLSDKKCREIVEASLKRGGGALPRRLCRVQTGQLRGDTLVASVHRTRMASLKSTLQARVTDGEKCVFLSGLRESEGVVGAWARDGHRSTVVCSVGIEGSSTVGVQVIARHTGYKVVDISLYQRIDGTAHAVYALVSSDCMSGASSSLESRPVNGAGSVQTWTFGPEALRSCACASDGHVLAVGMERGVRVLRPQDSGPAVDVWTHCEQPLSLEFADNVNLLLMGTHRGNVMCADLRDRPQSKHAYNTRLGRGVVSLRMAESDSMLLASAYDGKLVAMDVRNQQVVQEYRGHCNNGLKTPLSYSAADRTVCSAGHDRVVLLWRVGEVEPLTALKPGSGQYQPWPWYSSRLFCAVGNECFTFN